MKPTEMNITPMIIRSGVVILSAHEFEQILMLLTPTDLIRMFADSTVQEMEWKKRYRSKKDLINRIFIEFED